MKTEFLDFAEEKTNYFSIYLGKKPSQQWILFNSVLRKFTYALKLDVLGNVVHLFSFTIFKEYVLLLLLFTMLIASQLK